ncbi:MAG: hypothetical protein WC637_04565 [Victivallales bacterium]|jgi:hypothetical protein
MKRIALFVVLAYAVLFILLTWPVLLAAFYFPDKGFSNAGEVISCLKAPAYWIFIGILSLCQAGLLFIPVKIAGRRPTSKRSVYLPIIVSGFLAGALFLGIICSAEEFFQKDAAFKRGWEGWTAIGFCIIVWIIWSFVFCRATSGQEPKSVILRQCKHLLQGSVIALLVAVPTHIVARHRDYCCAGSCTFVGITFGIAVMLLSFGPGVYFLYAERWRKLHPDGGTGDCNQQSQLQLKETEIYREK